MQERNTAVFHATNSYIFHCRQKDITFLIYLDRNFSCKFPPPPTGPTYRRRFTLKARDIAPNGAYSWSRELEREEILWINLWGNVTESLIGLFHSNTNQCLCCDEPVSLRLIRET